MQLDSSIAVRDLTLGSENEMIQNHQFTADGSYETGWDYNLPFGARLNYVTSKDPLEPAWSPQSNHDDGRHYLQVSLDGVIRTNCIMLIIQ